MVFIESKQFSETISRFCDTDYAAFQRELAAQPESGDVMQGCGGFRKARMGFPSAGIGKSGGARVIYLHIPEKFNIHLIYIYGKSHKASLTPAEKIRLKEIAKRIRNAANT
jgi:hypothetical protein